jgi:AraC-like DNA-binding protein
MEAGRPVGNNRAVFFFSVITFLWITSARRRKRHSMEVRNRMGGGCTPAFLSGWRQCAEVARWWGYINASYFNRLFKSEYGSTPGAFIGINNERRLSSWKSKKTIKNYTIY